MSRGATKMAVRGATVDAVIRRHLMVLALGLALLATACGGGSRPTLDDPAVRAADLDTETEEPTPLLTGTATDLIDRTRTVTDLTDDGLAIDGGTAFTVDILGARGHDDAAFTQGLEFVGERLFESRGQYGDSAITEIDPISGDVIQAAGLSEEFFAEGLTVVDDRIIMLTWREGKAFVYDVDTLEQVDEFNYGGEGWGLCYDGESLYMSDGSSNITRRDPVTFERLELIRVTLNDVPVQRLNELECIEGQLWANVWTTNALVVIDPTTGDVTATIDATPVVEALDDDDADVLNGIAFDPSTGRLLLTGKYWSTMFDAELLPCSAAECVDVGELLGLG